MASESSGSSSAAWIWKVPSVYSRARAAATLAPSTDQPPPGTRRKASSLAASGGSASWSSHRYDVPERMATSRSSSRTVTQTRRRISASNSGMPANRPAERCSCSDMATRDTKAERYVSCSGLLALISASRAMAIMHSVRTVVRLGAIMYGERPKESSAESRNSSIQPAADRPVPSKR